VDGARTELTAPSVALAELLGADVRIGTVRVGEVNAVFVDVGGKRAIGLGVTGPGGVRRFLPWFAARVGNGLVSVDSALLLVDDGGSYERLGARPVRHRDALAGQLASHDGTIRPDAPVSPPLATGSTS